MTWEERWHPLREEWVIIAAHRQDRPWSGETRATSGKAAPEYVDDCYLCPRNVRVSGRFNPDYDRIFVFDNDHPCVAENAPDVEQPKASIYAAKSARGIARVVCYSPNHSLTLTELPVEQIDGLLKVWQEQYVDLGGRPEIDSVFVFENKGEVVGVSNPHPHCQIYATNFVFPTVATEIRAVKSHFETTGRVLFQDIIKAEQEDGRRIIAENDTAIAFLPYFARYAYEVYVAPKATHSSLAGLTDKERFDLADVLKKTLIKFDNLWQMPFPYVMPLFQAPTDGGNYDGFHFHIKFLPPLRKPSLLKYLGGPELGGGGFLSDTSPEEKAAELISMPDVHYKEVTK